MARMTRKEMLNTPDEFVTGTNTVLVWIKENPKQFAVGAIVIVSIIIGGYGLYYWKSSRDLDSMRAYLRAENNSQLTLQVAQDYSGTKAGKLAKLRLARMSYEQGNQKMALAYADEFINSWPGKDIFHWQAALIMANAYMQQKQASTALPLLDECIANAPKDIKDEALFLKAQALITLGRGLEARQVLKAVSENYKELAKITLASLGALPGESTGSKK